MDPKNFRFEKYTIDITQPSSEELTLSMVLDVVMKAHKEGYNSFTPSITEYETSGKLHKRIIITATHMPGW